MHAALVFIPLVIVSQVSPRLATTLPGSALEYAAPDYGLPSGTVHQPLNSSELTTLLNGGVLHGHTLGRGDVIELAAGATYTGSFAFPNLGPGTDWVYVVSSGVNSLSGEGTRISDSDIGNMATIQSPSGGGLAAGVDFGASHYRFVGIRFLSGRAAGQVQYGIVGTGYDGVDTNTPISQASDLPSDIVIDRCIIRGRGGQERDNWGLSMNALGMAVLDSVVDQIQDFSSADAQGIVTWMGGSQYRVQNSAISASGENFIAGGTATRLGIPPSDFVFRDCYFYKPLEWNENDPSYAGPYNGTVRAIKNLFELKNAQRVLVEGCTFSNSWTNARSAGQRGTAIVLTPRNGGSDEGGTVAVSDVEIRNSVFDNIETIIRTANADDHFKSQPLTRVWFHDNLAYNIKLAGGNGQFIRFATNNTFGSGVDQQATDLQFTHNTAVAGPSGAMNWYGTIYHEGVSGMMTNTVIRDNLIQGSSGNWAVSGTGGPTPIDTLNSWHTNYEFDHNAIFGDGLNGTYPPGNWTGTTVTQASIGFANYNALDFSLNPNSNYAAGNPQQASDGLNLGANLDLAKTEKPSSIVLARRIFYNDSYFDGYDLAINAADDGAVDLTKSAYLPGSGPATFANITGYDKGINGIAIDMAGGGAHTTITANDFVFKVGNDNSPDDWALAPAPLAISVRPGAGVDGSDRVEITWAAGAIANTWLQVQILSTDRTGLADNGDGVGDTFYWGNAIGGSGDGDSDEAAPTNASDEIGARLNPHGFINFASVADAYDYNKDRYVNATDQLIARNNATGAGTQLTKINLGAAAPHVAAEQFAIVRRESGLASAVTASSWIAHSAAGLPHSESALPEPGVAEPLRIQPAAELMHAMIGQDDSAEDFAGGEIAIVDVDTELLETLAIGALMR